MKVEVVLHYADCDKEFHYEFYINGIWICAFCSIECIKYHLKKNLWRLSL